MQRNHVTISSSSGTNYSQYYALPSPPPLLFGVFYCTTRTLYSRITAARRLTFQSRITFTPRQPLLFGLIVQYRVPCLPLVSHREIGRIVFEDRRLTSCCFTVVSAVCPVSAALPVEAP